MIYFNTCQDDDFQSFTVNENSAPQQKKEQWKGPFPPGTPKDNLNQLLRKYKEIDDIAQQVCDLSATCHSELQSSINHIKEYTGLISSDERNNTVILSEVRSIISSSSEKKIQQCTKIIQKTCEFRSKARLITQKSDLVIEPKHQLPSIERCFQTLLSLYRKLVHQAKKIKNSDTKLCQYQRDLNKKLSMISCWVRRWRGAVVEIEADRYKLSVLAMRHKLIATFELENKEMEEEVQHAEILYDALNDELNVPQEDKCANEDRFISVLDEYQVLKEEVDDAKDYLERLEGEARDLDSLYVEESYLLQNIEVELKEFYEYFSKRPVIKSVQQAVKMSKFARKAMEKLSGVAGEIDAVCSIQDIKSQISSVHCVPFNVYTSHTLKAAWSHWENTLQSAGEMLQWLELQAKIASKLDSCGNFEKQMESLAHETRELIADIVRGHSGKEVVIDQNSTDHRVKKFERTFMKLCKTREEKTALIVQSAGPLHNRGQTTPQVIDLLNCWNHCIFSVLLLLDDALYQSNLLDLTSPTMEDLIKRKILLAQSSDFYSNLGGRIFCARDNLKISESGGIIILPPGDKTGSAVDDINFKCDVDSVSLQSSTKLDPYGRITCAAWLDMVYRISNPDIRVPTLLLKRQELEHNFSLLCDGKPFLTDRALKRLTRKYAGLWEYCQKNITEYFGPESERHAKKGITCYDYKRFTCKLLGLRRKLSVIPN